MLRSDGRILHEMIRDFNPRRGECGTSHQVDSGQIACHMRLHRFYFKGVSAQNGWLKFYLRLLSA